MDQPPVVVPPPQVVNPATPIKIKRKKRLVQVLQKIGPGLITGASDDDPSSIATYVVAGSRFGYATLWTALYTLPMMIVVQYICAKIGLVSGKGLGSVLRENYPRRLVYPVVFTLLIAKVIAAGVDMGAIAAAIGLVLPIPVPVLVVLVTLVILAFQIWGRIGCCRVSLSGSPWLYLPMLLPPFLPIRTGAMSCEKHWFRRFGSTVNSCRSWSPCSVRR